MIRIILYRGIRFQICAGFRSSRRSTGRGASLP